MFTIKLYRDGDYRQRILEAESFTVLRNECGDAEITLHRKSQADDVRYDIHQDADAPGEQSGPERFAKAIIENAAGRTTEIITTNGMPRGRLIAA